MAVPKRRHSKARSGRQNTIRNKRTALQGIKTKTGIRRPHVEEDKKI
jgi:ribosomal protein L32